MIEYCRLEKLNYVPKQMLILVQIRKQMIWKDITLRHKKNFRLRPPLLSILCLKRSQHIDVHQPKAIASNLFRGQAITLRF